MVGPSTRRPHSLWSRRPRSRNEVALQQADTPVEPPAAIALAEGCRRVLSRPSNPTDGAELRSRASANAESGAQVHHGPPLLDIRPPRRGHPRIPRDWWEVAWRRRESVSPRTSLRSDKMTSMAARTMPVRRPLGGHRPGDTRTLFVPSPPTDASTSFTLTWRPRRPHSQGRSDRQHNGAAE